MKFDPNSTENEGRYRIRNPKEFNEDTFKRWHSWEGIGERGVSYVVGKLKGKERESGNELQAIRFDKSLWDQERAGKFIKEHGFKRISVGSFD